MNKRDQKIIEKKLNEDRERLLREIANLDQSFMESLKDSSGDLSAYSFHMADQGTDAMEREKAFLFASRDEKYLKQIEAAYARISEGSFGICRSCQKEISKERLEAVPTTTICFDCKSKEAK